MSVNIITLGFDGPNRSGKATQCALLQNWLAARGVTSLIIRGAGSRPGRGHQPGDPHSIWWQEVNHWLHAPQTNQEAWHITSYRLARELIVWRDRVLPCVIKTRGQTWGVLLVDRTLLSRTMIPRARQYPDVANYLYPEHARLRGRRITPALICPDLIFNLIAPPEVLMARLGLHDPKYNFRRRLIHETSHWFRDAVRYLPEPLQSRVVEIDASREAEVVFESVLFAAQSCFEPLRCLR